MSCSSEFPGRLGMDQKDLLKKSQWLLALAQQEKVEDLDDPSKTSVKIRQTASKALDYLKQLVANKQVEESYLKPFNSLGDLLSDFLPTSLRFQDKDLDEHWEGYLNALMNKVNSDIFNAATLEKSNYFKNIFKMFSEVWDTLSKTNEAKASKMPMKEWNGEIDDLAKDPWEGREDPGTAKTLNQAIQTRVDEAPTTGTMPLKLNSQKNRLQKLSNLLKVK